MHTPKLSGATVMLAPTFQDRLEGKDLSFKLDAI
jgi:hypothetical protein